MNQFEFFSAYSLCKVCCVRLKPEAPHDRVTSCKDCKRVHRDRGGWVIVDTMPIPFQEWDQ